jgi:hypothetical protein
MIPVTYIREKKGHEMSWSTYFLMLISSVLLFSSFIFVATADAATPTPRLTQEIRTEARLFRMAPVVYLRCVDTLIGTPYNQHTRKVLRPRCQRVWDFQIEKIKQEMARIEAEQRAAARELDRKLVHECYNYFLEDRSRMQRVTGGLTITQACSKMNNYGKKQDGSWYY